MFKKFLVPVDGSAPSWRALETAKSMAEKYDGDLIVVHVVQSLSTRGLIVNGMDASIKTDAMNSTTIGNMILDTAKDRLKDFKGQTDFEMEFGDVSEKIMEIAKAKDASAIVVGRRGLSGVEEFLLGSVSSRLVQYSDIPVMVVR